MFTHHIPHLFYEPAMLAQGITLLNEEESGHIIKVLRRRVGDVIHTTDGCGNLYKAEIIELQKRNVALKIIQSFRAETDPNPGIHIAIAPLKMNDRFEWFLEKAVEIGVSSITPILTKNTERSVLKPERLQKIMVAAMKQSQRLFLPVLHPLTPYSKWIKTLAPTDYVKMMGWCGEGDTLYNPQALKKQGTDTYILIGPEGDFTPEEAQEAKEAGFLSISLGRYRLRTETAGVVALTLVNG
jgi:16S rRNA (uracil1498-N3)-methyltransferase